MRQPIVVPAFLGVLLLSGAGCAGYGGVMALSQASMVMGTASQAVGLGTSIASLIEQTDVKVAIAPGITGEDLRRIKRIALVFQVPGPMGESLSAVMADNVTLELLTLGYQVVDRERVTKITERRGSGAMDPETAAKVGRTVGLDAVVLGSVTASGEYAGGFMVNRIGMGQVVQNATLRVVGVTRGEVLMVVALSYKNGQTPAEAAKVMAYVLREKLQGSPAGKS